MRPGRKAVIAPKVLEWLAEQWQPRTAREAADELGLDRHAVLYALKTSDAICVGVDDGPGRRGPPPKLWVAP